MQTRFQGAITYPEVLRSQLGLHSPLQKHIDYCRFSESPLWSVQRQYFQAQGIQPWRTESIPFYATSNPCLARAYAKVVVEYWQDSITAKRIDVQHVMPIVEMGCGSGTFTFYFLKALEHELAMSPIASVQWQLICTDISAANGRFITHHPKLKQYVNDKKLVVGVFDVETQSAIMLNDGQTVVSFNNPCVAIANYLFDSLTQDLFHLHYGGIYEAHVGLMFSASQPSSSDEVETTRANGPDQRANEFLDDGASSELSVTPLSERQFHVDNPFENMDIDYRWLMVDDLSWLSYEIQQQINAYVIDFDSNVLLYPTGAVQCISHLREMANNGLLLLGADKGFYKEQDARLQAVPVPSIQGSFSLPVNFNALTRYCENQGGLSWCSKHREDGLVYSAMLFDDNALACGNTQAAIFRNFEQTSPDHLIPIARGLFNQNGADEPAHDRALDEMLSYIQLFSYCPKIVEIFLPSLLKQVHSMTLETRKRWCASLDKVWANTYFLGGDPQILFDLGALALDLNAWGLASNIYQELLSHSATEPATYFNLALAYTHLAHWGAAVKYLESGIQLMSVNGMASLDEQNLLQSSVELKEYCSDKLQTYNKKIPSNAIVEKLAIPLAKNLSEDTCFLTPLDSHFSVDILHQCRDRNISALTRLPNFESIDDVNGWVDAQEAFENKHMYCVIHKTQGFVGLAGVHQAENAGYFFFCIGTDYQDIGIGTQALALIKKQSLALGIHALYSGVYSDNTRSLAVLAKHKFIKINARAEEPDNTLNFYYLNLIETAKQGESGESSGLAALLYGIKSPIVLLQR